MASWFFFGRSKGSKKAPRRDDGEDRCRKREVLQKFLFQKKEGLGQRVQERRKLHHDTRGKNHAMAEGVRGAEARGSLPEETLTRQAGRRMGGGRTWQAITHTGSSGESGGRRGLGDSGENEGILGGVHGDPVGRR